MTVNTRPDITSLNFAYTLDAITLTDLIKQLPEESQRIYVFGVPTYNNLGDQAINEAQRRFFTRNFPEMVYIEITEPQTDQAIEELLPLLRSDDMIAYTGGGNIGSLHTEHEVPRRKVFSTFVNNKTFSFPQSVYFEDSKQGQEELRKSQEAYDKNPNLILIARDTQSLDYLKKHFKANAIYTADMVLSLQPDRPEFTRDGVLLIMRVDNEKVTSDKLVERLTNNLEDYDNDVGQTDTILPYKEFPEGDKSRTASPLDEVRISERGWLVDLKLDQIKTSEVVVTDRLHAMIFCVLTKTPCLVFDNSYGKASSFYYNWFEDLDHIQHTTEKDPQKLIPMIEELKKFKQPRAHDFSHSYDALIDLIKK
ncbi:polysaccharide pyruvyl transferase family protein [Tetragenococcus solitarius]|uniref:Polysaccharide pyruvyl transferase family protein n=1 Tax=Tetragenococcus solitarius TaxID=71453 RepID=A0ABP6KW26_9ENTE|nr:polysaccharide pyruvyl transferase family protein [Tetragenococcus solitarius]